MSTKPGLNLSIMPWGLFLYGLESLRAIYFSYISHTHTHYISSTSAPLAPEKKKAADGAVSPPREVQDDIYAGDLHHRSAPKKLILDRIRPIVSTSTSTEILADFCFI